MNKRNKVITIIVVLLAVFLAVLWSRERAYRVRLNRLKAEVVKLEINVHLLRVRTEALKQEMEMLNLATYMKLMKKMERLK
ncbi:MAG: hypothetical protein GTO45_16460 [Candidatus Aminicenantes bacterium]|nr:hypothetical protein [Candidatus Aminicenantes bacterium]NIM78294.1 hypothetical protein [Candidatus Aminicenantes bacterium]NIN19720.1 hypothetical protein [Candidatus Aminicenantes bacterium]NIN43602.1 hypothetical protein [Candidatus Aminicenantes bacterium]NIN86347.1 hypothetical protein [Candidatus Aminicenantes bacterium]